MLTISNGHWMSSSISFSRIRAVVNGAQISAQTGVENAALKLGRCENFIDYVFCGRVKKAYLEYLHHMTLEMIEEERYLRTHAEESGNRTASRHRLKCLTYSINKWDLCRLMRGSILEFVLSPSKNSGKWESYLIYRDRRRLLSKGISLDSPGSAMSTLNPLRFRLVPTFASIDEIQTNNLEDIRRSGTVNCGNQTFTVRFARNNEPIVIQSGENRVAELIQLKLNNLCVIAKEMQKLAKFRSHPVQTSDFSHGLVLPPSTNESCEEYAQWKKFSNIVQEKFNNAIGILNLRLEAESRLLEQELGRFEKLSTPTRVDKQSFLELQQKIKFLIKSRQRSDHNFMIIRSKLERICDSYRDIHGEAQVFFKIRIFRLCELITEFAMLKQDDEATKKFKIFCEDQLEFLQQFSLSEFEELINPPKIKSWKYRNIHPPIFQAQHEILFNMLKDPAILWDQIDLAMRRLRIEQDAQIELRIRQIELGYKLERRLNTALTNGHGNRIIASQGNFSPEYIHRMDMLEQTRRDLLSPGKNFRQLELINLSTTIDRNLFLAEVECRRNGFEAGVMVRNAEIGQPIRANPI